MNLQEHLIKQVENKLWNLFKSLNDEGVTIIMITHDANVASHAKKILHIIDGEIIENKQGGVL